MHFSAYYRRSEDIFLQVYSSCDLIKTQCTHLTNTSSFMSIFLNQSPILL